MPVNRRVFATLDDGTKVDQFTLTTEQLEVSLITFGASITNFILLTKNNLDVCPAYPTIDGYLENPFKMGASVGRVINRLSGGEFSIDGKTFHVDKNFNNKHCIHGGRKDFVHYNWKVEEERLTDHSVTLSHVSEDGDMGFPGKLIVFVTFTLEEEELRVEYTATTDAPTPVNLTCHCYFNLAGHSAGKTALMQHKFQLNADHYLVVDDDFLPVKRDPVDNTIFDLRDEFLLGTVLDGVNNGVGFDNYFCMTDDNKRETEWHAKAQHKDVCLHMSSNQPGFQFYNNYYINVDDGKDGADYRRHCSFAFEAHGYPDAVNHPEFPSIVLRPGENYCNRIKFKLFTCDDS